MLRDDSYNSPLIARYTSAAETEYFGWADATHDTPSGLANKFIQRFPQIAETGRGSDWLYAGWYVEMLHLTYPNHFPYAIADWETLADYLPTFSVGGSGEVRVPSPPPGRAPGPPESRPS